MSRTKLPTINVTSCLECPFLLEVYGFSSALADSVCTFPLPDSPDRADEYSEVLAGYQLATPGYSPDWCPGKKYDIAVEFPDE